MKKIIFLAILLLLLNPSGWATNYCDSAEGCWLFTEGSGTTVADDSPNSNVGNFASSGHPAWATMSGTGAPAYSDYNVYSVYQATDYIASSLVSTTKYNFTFTAWVYIDGNYGTRTGVFFNGNSDAGNGYGLFMGASDSNPSNVCILASALYWLNTGIAWEDGVWKHYSVIRNATGTTWELYVDGVSSYTSANKADPNTPATITYLTTENATHNYSNDGATERAFFEDILNSTEINDIMDNGLAGSAPPPARRMFIVS